MKKQLLFLFTVLILTNSCNKEKLDPDLIKTFNLYSNYTSTDYKIKVALPENYSATLKYETLYLLDGEFKLLLNHAVNESKKISESQNKQNIIVVAIGGQAFRERDYTPTKTNGGGDGGADNFSKFLEQELIPKIEQDFNVDTTAKSRIIIGHSYGGLFTGFLFAKYPNLFSNYITLSPSLFYDDGVVLKYELENRNLSINRSAIIYIGNGELESYIGVFAQEWYHRIATYYPMCKVKYNTAKYSHVSSGEQNITNGLEHYFKNK